MAQRPSPRVPLHLKTTVCSEANGVVRHLIDRSSPKLEVDRRSPRSSPMHEKKPRGTRVADLETKLTQTQDEIKKLKQQLVAVEAAKRDAQQELEKTKLRLVVVVPSSSPVEEEEEEEEEEASTEQEEEEDNEQQQEESVNSPATDVFEVVPLVNTKSIKEKDDKEEVAEKEEVDTETKTMIEEEEGNGDVLLSSELTLKLDALVAENEGLKKQAEESAHASLAKEEEMNKKIEELEEELRESKEKNDRLEAVVGEKETIETEMRKLRVQTEQWRKAAEAAAAVLSDGNGRRVSERCGSMEKHVNVGFSGSPGLGMEEVGKRPRGGGGGMKMFGDLWKKKGHNNK